MYLLRKLHHYIFLFCLLFITSQTHAQQRTVQPHAHCTQTSISPIKFASLNWESGQFFTAVLRHIAENGFGCDTVEVPATGTALEVALSQNDIQVISEQWVGRSPIMIQAIHEGKVKVVGNTLKGGATQGWYIPHYVKKQYPDINTYQDLLRHAEIFTDPENPKRARFLNCPTGWTCEIFNSRLLNNTKLNQAFNNVRSGTGAALDAEIASAFEQQKPLLFYYWQPSSLMAKYQFHPIEFPSFDQACWDDLIDPQGQRQCVSDFIVSQLSIAVSSDFTEQYPDLINAFDRVQFEPDMLNQIILAMKENQRSGAQQAKLFFEKHPDIWQTWLPIEAIQRINQNVQVNNPKQISTTSWYSFPNWSLEKSLNQGLNQIVQQYGGFFRQISQITLHYLLLPIESALHFFPPWLLIVLTALLAWVATRKIWFASLCAIGLFLIGAFGLWSALISTIALLSVSVLLTILLGLPTGILIAGNKLLRRIITPMLDVMQTMPSFVYLIPVLMLFGIVKVPALFATVIYALPPLIRLTMLGINQVDKEMLEAGRAFGSSRWQMLIFIKLPQALPSIMAGINQAIMMSLSMVVLASMIGAPGLGEDVLQSIQTLNIGQGLQAGTAIVIIAIIIDRIIQAFGHNQQKQARKNP